MCAAHRTHAAHFGSHIYKKCLPPPLPAWPGSVGSHHSFSLPGHTCGLCHYRGKKGQTPWPYASWPLPAHLRPPTGPSYPPPTMHPQVLPATYSHLKAHLLRPEGPFCPPPPPKGSFCPPPVSYRSIMPTSSPQVFRAHLLPHTGPS